MIPHAEFEDCWVSKCQFLAAKNISGPILHDICYITAEVNKLLPNISGIFVNNNN